MKTFGDRVKQAVLKENKYYNKNLNPCFWNSDDTFNQEVREKLLNIAYDVAGEVELDPSLIEDIQLTGSLANYNYTDFSDLDVHILLDFAKINADEDLVKKALDGKRNIWNLKHDIKIGGYDVEVYFQDVDEPHKASGLFSLMNDEWITKPVHNEPTIDERDVVVKANKIKGEIDDLEVALQTSEGDDLGELTDAAKALMEKIKKIRKDSLQAKGEFGIGNLTFKELRNQGYLDKLSDIKVQLYDKQFSSGCSI